MNNIIDGTAKSIISWNDEKAYLAHYLYNEKVRLLSAAMSSNDI